MTRVLKSVLASLVLVFAASAAQAGSVTYELETPGVV